MIKQASIGRLAFFCGRGCSGSFLDLFVLNLCQKERHKKLLFGIRVKTNKYKNYNGTRLPDCITQAGEMPP